MELLSNLNDDSIRMDYTILKTKQRANCTAGRILLTREFQCATEAPGQHHSCQWSRRARRERTSSLGKCTSLQTILISRNETATQFTAYVVHYSELIGGYVVNVLVLKG